MNAKGMVISTLLIIDTFLVSFAFGFNSRHVKVIDPSMPPYQPPAASLPPTKATPKTPAPKSTPGEKSASAKKPGVAPKKKATATTTAGAADKKKHSKNTNQKTDTHSHDPKAK